MSRSDSEVTSIHHREISFHDDWASSTGEDEVLVYESFEGLLALEGRHALSLMGDIKGKTLLDVGCGLGESSTYFALMGAHVIANDISPKMIELAKRTAARYNTQIDSLVSPAEALDLPDNSIDICYVANLLHHVTDQVKVLQEIHRVLKPGGVLISWDPLGYNPVINVYRQMATAVRTDDEEPLRFDILSLFADTFQSVQHRQFWFLSLLIFVKYYLIDRVHPNDDRYWKRILKETSGTIPWIKPLLKLDNWLLKLPLLRRMAWTIVIYARK